MSYYNLRKKFFTGSVFVESGKQRKFVSFNHYENTCATWDLLRELQVWWSFCDVCGERADYLNPLLNSQKMMATTEKLLNVYKTEFVDVPRTYSTLLLLFSISVSNKNRVRYSVASDSLFVT